MIKGPRSRKMTVPGSKPVAINRDPTEGSAHDALARVAALIDLDRDWKVLIVGHTDTVGDAIDGAPRSERRAALVKPFFIDHLEVELFPVGDRGQGRGTADCAQ